RDGDTGFRIIAGERREGRRDIVATLTDALANLSDNTQQHAFAAIKTIQGFLRTVVRSIFGLGLVLMLSAYLLVTTDRVFEFLRLLVRPSRQQNFNLLLRRIDRGLSGVVRGQLMIALVNGVLSGILFYALNLNYWPVLTLIATVLSVIPIFGAILSSIPAVLVGFQSGFTTAGFVLIGIIGIHQLEANVLNPKIMGDAAKVHPVLVVFALLGGEHLFGLAGALLAVPLLSITQSLFLHFRELALGVPTPRTLRASAFPPPGP
ncbi:MAG: AI-2E family transporter, partial [Myxococcales bacterium]|nr:AI-2E family transporter [Myxococcales bacterium]